MKTKLQILQESLDYIAKNGRAQCPETGSCKYKMEKQGKIIQCLVGRCLIPELYKEEMEGKTARDIFDLYGEEVFEPAYRGHSPDFWRALQALHDHDGNWNDENKLTKMGIRELREICANFYIDIIKLDI